MATCPRCYGALTENHRCPRGRLSRVTDALSTVATGGAVGIVLCYLLNERPVLPLLMAAAALGSVLAMALRQAISGRPS
jgi:hypothetical protein